MYVCMYVCMYAAIVEYGAQESIFKSLARTTPFLTHPNFNRYVQYVCTYVSMYVYIAFK